MMSHYLCHEFPFIPYLVKLYSYSLESKFGLIIFIVYCVSIIYYAINIFLLA